MKIGWSKLRQRLLRIEVHPCWCFPLGSLHSACRCREAALRFHAVCSETDKCHVDHSDADPEVCLTCMENWPCQTFEALTRKSREATR